MARGRRRKAKNRQATNSTNDVLQSIDDEDNKVQSTRWKWSEERSKIFSDAFIEFYRAQHIVEAEHWNDFVATASRPLPLTFRFNDCRSSFVQSEIKRWRDGAFNDIDVVVPQDDVDVDYCISPPRELNWYGNDGAAWQVGVSKRQLKKFEALSALRAWLIDANTAGTINRQEMASMLPPLLMNVKPYHVTLDMCAAPGSKTAQLIEALHADAAAKGFIPSGIVLANDASEKRAFVLVTNLKRLASPCVLIVNHEGQSHPKLPRTMSVDRILCDVPCSGDGTTRKNVNIINTWSPSSGIALHRLQLSIARRSVQMLADGALMVYSTCSLNPIENEAVVAALLRDGDVELVDVSDQFAGLRVHAGLSTWKVFDKDMCLHLSYESTPETLRKAIQQTMFPPTNEEIRIFMLERCLRLLCHDQDSGSFFVALLRRKSKQIHAEHAASHTAKKVCLAVTTDTAITQAKKSSVNVIEGTTTSSKKKCCVRKSDSFPLGRFVRLEEHAEGRAVIASLIARFGLTKQFPTHLLWSRGSIINLQRIVLVNERISDILSASFGSDGEWVSGMHVVAAGMRVFDSSKSSAPIETRFRFVHETASFMSHYVTKQILHLTRSTLQRLVESKRVERSSIKSDADINALNAVLNGSVLIVCVEDESFVTCAHLGAQAIDLMVSDTILPTLRLTLAATTR